MSYADVLSSKGFAKDEKAAEVLHADANDPNTGEGSLGHNGDYTVHEVWRKDGVTAVLEQNTAPEDLGGGMTALVTHPKVLIVEGPNGRCPVQLHDLDVLDDVLEAVA
jgi:hypothetical protein